MPLTGVAIKKAKPSNRPRKIADCFGLYLLINPNGSRWWRFRYRFEGREKLLSMGTYPATSLAVARERCNAARQLLRSGVDPSRARQSTKQPTLPASGDTFEAVARGWMAYQQVSQATADKNRWLFETFLFPPLGALPLAAVTPRVLLDALRAIEASGKAETARRAKIKAGQVFRYALLDGRCDSDPTVSLRGALKPAQTTHRAAITDPKCMGALLQAIDSYMGRVITQRALQLAPLLFVRPGELRWAVWSEFDLGAALWRIPGERMKMKAPHLVPLSTQAVALLRALHINTGNDRYLFPSRSSTLKPIGENTLNSALRRLGYSKEEMTAHGFRSMAATRLNELGWNSDAIERQLAHAESNKVRGAYTHAAQYLDERKRMMQAWADYLDSLRHSQEAPEGRHGPSVPSRGEQHLPDTSRTTTLTSHRPVQPLPCVGVFGLPSQAGHNPGDSSVSTGNNDEDTAR